MMASNQVLLAVFEEVERLKKIPFAELVEAVSGAKDFYGEGDIPSSEKEG